MYPNKRPGLVLGAHVNMLEAGRVGHVMRLEWPELVRPDTTRPVFAVVESGRIKGMISVPEITQIMNQADISDIVVAGDMMTPEPTVLSPEDDLYAALAAMARNNGVVLPVVACDEGSRFLGMLTRADIYHHVRTQLDNLRKHLVLEHEALPGQLQAGRYR